MGRASPSSSLPGLKLTKKMPGRVAAKQAASGLAAWGTQWMAVRNYRREVLNPAHQDHPGGFEKPWFPAICQANWIRTSGGRAQTSGIFLAPQGLQCSAEDENHHPSLPRGGICEWWYLQWERRKKGPHICWVPPMLQTLCWELPSYWNFIKCWEGLSSSFPGEESAAHRAQ